MEQVPDQNKDEIDLVDIFIVLFKRKWLIIILVIAAVILSAIYVALSKNNYTANIIIAPPQEYKIKEGSILEPTNIILDDFLNDIKSELSISSSGKNEGQKEEYFANDVEIMEKEVEIDLSNIKLSGDKISLINETEEGLINIKLSGQKEKIEGAVSSLYNLFYEFQNDIYKKNQNIFIKTQDDLQSIIEQKREMLNKTMPFLDERTLSQNNHGAVITALNSIITLDCAVTDLEETKELNKTVRLNDGDFVMVAGNLETGQRLSIDKNNLENVGSYIIPEKSKKRQLLPVIVSAFLAFFVGIFLAFVIEFFSREDVKRRLKEINR